MCKKETFFVRLAIATALWIPLYGDITMGIMSSMQNNAKMYLLYNNAYIECKPFGVIPLENMTVSAINPKECASRIEQLYRSSPHDKGFAREHLILLQSYHFELLKDGCILYANGPESYSEMLLANGLAVVDPKLDNNEWSARLKRAQKGAENLAIGLHAGELKKFCLKEDQ